MINHDCRPLPVPGVCLVILLTGLALLTVAVPARSMGIAPCDDPRVFGGAALNTVILPFRYTGRSREQALSEAAQRLTRLVQLDILFSLIKHGSIGVIELHGQPAGCDVDEVLAKLIRGNGKDKLLPGHALILLWGRLYEEGGFIYLQNYMKFLRRGQEESLTYAPSSSDTTLQEFAASLPAQAVAFAPRRLNRRDLQDIIEESSQATIIRPSPDREQPGQPLDVRDSSQRFGYWVTDIEGDWLKIQAQDGSSSGWVQARRSATSPLNRIMPELSFLDGVAGYLRYQVGRDREEVSAAPPQTLQRVGAAFSTYQEAIEQRSEPLNMAIARALEGVLLVRSHEADPNATQALNKAAGLFAQARQLAPYNAGARNLDFIGGLIKAERRSADPSGLALTQSLLDTVAVDPDNRVTLANLENLYRYFQATAVHNPFTADELEKRLNTVEKIRSHGE
jgi:hypothetical protein